MVLKTMATHYNLAEFDASAYNLYVENLRRIEYDSLQTTTYLDHAGTTLYARSLLDAFHHDLTSNLFGNPHSISPASNLSTLRVDEARSAVLDYFNADHDAFDVVFTSSATSAIKLVADCFRDQEFDYYYHKDSHSSIVGVRELAKVSECLVSSACVENFISQDTNGDRLKLFAYPAQSNMTGYRPPLNWSSRIRKHCKNTYVLLDAASYLTSRRLDLSDSDHSADFIALSFYKIFGFPTGLGALIVRKASSEVLKQRRYFGGGTVDQVTVIGGQTHAIKETSLHDRLEDGTLAFHLIASLKHAINVHKRLYKSADFISSHCASLTRWLYNSMDRLRHKNGNHVAELYKDPQATYGDPVSQGPIIAFSILRSDGTYVGKSHFERLANDCGFQIRTGGVCNPGGIASMLRLQHWELRRNFAEGVRCGDDVDIMGSKPTGIIRVSLGPMSTMLDVERFVCFLENFFVDRSTLTTRMLQDIGESITPVRGCAGFRVNVENYSAYQTWNDQWCLILDDTKQPLDIVPCDIQVKIDVKDETLVFDNDFRMSLWDIPSVSEIQTLSADDERKWDTYTSPVNTWLTEKLGKPCSLARYRALDVRERSESLTCVVSGCYAQQKSIDNLHQHYRKHAQSFLERYPFKAQDQGPISSATLEKVQDRLAKDHLDTIEMATCVPDRGPNNTSTRIAKIKVLSSNQSLKTATSEDTIDSKPIPTREKKQKRHSIVRVFTRSKA